MGDNSSGELFRLGIWNQFGRILQRSLHSSGGTGAFLAPLGGPYFPALLVLGLTLLIFLKLCKALRLTFQLEFSGLASLFLFPEAFTFSGLSLTLSEFFSTFLAFLSPALPFFSRSFLGTGFNFQLRFRGLTLLTCFLTLALLLGFFLGGSASLLLLLPNAFSSSCVS